MTDVLLALERGESFCLCDDDESGVERWRRAPDSAWAQRIDYANEEFDEAYEQRLALAQYLSCNMVKASRAGVISRLAPLLLKALACDVSLMIRHSRSRG